MSVLDHISLLIWQSMTSDKGKFPQIKIKEINPFNSPRLRTVWWWQSWTYVVHVGLVLFGHMRSNLFDILWPWWEPPSRPPRLLGFKWCLDLYPKISFHLVTCCTIYQTNNDPSLCKYHFWAPIMNWYTTKKENGLIRRKWLLLSKWMGEIDLSALIVAGEMLHIC